MVAVVGASGVPVGVGAAVVPLTARVIPLPLESPSVALKNLIIQKSQLAVGSDSNNRERERERENCGPTCLFGGGRASPGGFWVWVGGQGGGGVSWRLGLVTEEDVELQRDRFEYPVRGW